MSSKRKNVADAATLDMWRAIVNMRKSIFGWPVWSHVPPLPGGPRVRTSRSELHTAYAETTEAHVQMADEFGIGLDGVQLHLTAWAFWRNSDVTATLEVVGGRSFVTIARVDGWPSDPHVNSRKIRQISGLKHLPTEVAGSHVHRFDDNAILGREAFGAGVDGNLPVAVAIPGELGSFREFLRTVGRELNIAGLEDIAPPDGWQGII